ncbi:MAG: LysM peptidoglycan-binding domain-containing protein [Pseudomonadota bacterium]
MIKLRFIFVPALFLFFLLGCTQSLQNTTPSRDNRFEPAGSGTPKGKNAAPDRKRAGTELRGPDDSNGADGSVYSASAVKAVQLILDEALGFCQVAQDFWQKGELENALEALDKAYSLILTVDTDIPKLVQQKEDLRFMISKRILEIYASRNTVVNGDFDAIPMVMNKHIQAELDLFTTGKEQTFFMESYRRSGRYRPFIVKALTEAGLPVELSWLPLIESGFKVNALSRARALGLWQFIPSTGYKFGLNRDNFIDERIDPVKATNAAISYLKELHQIFGDWATVLAGYNCGEGQVLRVIRSQNINYLDNFWDLYQRLPQETARYVPRFMATLHIVKNPEKYGLDKIQVDPPLIYETVEVAKQVSIKDVALKIGVSEKTLVELNPELRHKILPRDKYPLRLPPGKTGILLAKLDEIPEDALPRNAYAYHRVRPGETLSTIAGRYHTSVSSIARSNNLARQNLIIAGTNLKIPLKGTVAQGSKTHARQVYTKASTHVVRKGDSLWILAKRYGTTTKEIQGKNNLSTTALYIGQVLKIPGDGDEGPSRNELKTYLVKQGDSPFQISQRHKMPLEQLLRINRLTPRSTIYPGQKLYVE